MREGMEMEMPVVETSHGAPPLLQEQQCLLEKQRRAAVGRRREQLRGRSQLHDGRAQGGVARQGCASRLPILEMYAASGGGGGGGGVDEDSSRGASSPLPQRSATAADVFAEGEGVFGYHLQGYSVPDASPGAGIGRQEEELGFLGRLRSLRIGDERDLAAAAMLENNPVDPGGIWTRRGDESSESVLLNSPSLFLRNPMVLSNQEKPNSSAPLQHCHLTSSWLRPCRLPHRQEAPPSRSDGLCSQSIDDAWGDLQLHRDFVLGRNRYQTVTQAVDPLFVEETEAIEEFLASQKKRIGCGDHFDVSTPPSLPQMVLPSSPSGFPILAQQKGLSSSCYNLQSVSPVRNLQGIKALACEDSFIIQGNELHCLPSTNGYGLLKERKRGHTDSRLNTVGPSPVNMDNVQMRGPRCLPFLVPKYQSLMDILGFMFLAAKDQYGCRFLQRKFDEGTGQEREMIFNEIIDHVPELMVNPFGNYLMQKVLDVCTENQRLEIILVLTKDPTELVRISLNMHGTRAVQRLIETLKSKKQTALVISALQPGFLSLIKDPNGNHVIQRCLQYFSYDDNKFIFDAAARHCVDIARHRHGCCVLQRCIAHSTGHHQIKLLAEVSRNGLILAQDAYGNYAVQYILDLKHPLAIENLKSEFKGNYVQLSMQKFSSNVVEKCLSVFDEIGKRRIISELLSVTCFEQLMQDPYANYVIQSALLVCKGHARSLLVDAIRPHDAVLKTSPYCKRIFNLLKK